MRACVRPGCPAWLDEHWEAWGAEYQRRLLEDPRHRFSWKRFDGERVNHRLLPTLEQMTDGHCAYCDWFPTDVGTDRTIDHFKPKSRFPREAYHWPNLYLCCRTCQAKDDASYRDDLLRPDEAEFEFDRYFVFDYSSGTLEPNPSASMEERSRAALTIEHFHLNRGGRPTARLRELRHFRAMGAEERRENLPERPFRYLLVHEIDVEP